jgi:hypothetical protein
MKYFKITALFIFSCIFILLLGIHFYYNLQFKWKSDRVYLPDVPTSNYKKPTIEEAQIANGPHLIPETCYKNKKSIDDFEIRGISDIKEKCAFFSEKGISFFGHGYFTPVGRLPYILITHQKNKIRLNNIIIWLPGGPSDLIWFGYHHILTRFKEKLSAEYDAIIIPAYYGTGYRSAHPRIGVTAAAEEISFLHDYLIKIHNSKIRYLTFSSGGIVANELSLIRSISSISINPPLITIEEADRRGKARLDPSYANGEEAGILNDGEGFDFGDHSITRPRLVDHDDWKRKYFGEYSDKKTIMMEENSLNKNSNCRSIIIGNKDERIGVDVIPSIKNKENFTIIPNLDHFVDNTADIEKVLVAIREAAERCPLNL